MASLPNFPMVSQLTTITSDGRPSENAQFDCVPASIGAALLWLEGKRQWDASINPDLLKDKAYGEALHNSGTAASAYVPFCQSLGYKLFHIDGSPGTLIQETHTELALGHPVVFTEPDPYVPASYGWSHVCVFYGEVPGELTCLDPYIGKPITRSDAEWQQMLMFNQIWVVERISTVAIPQGWSDDGTTLTAPNEVKVVHGFRLKVLEGWHPDNWPLGQEYNTASLEDSNKSLGAGDQQMFRFSMLGWTQARGVFEEYLGVELEYARAQLVKAYDLNQQLQKQVAALQAQQGQSQGDATLQQQLDAANQKLAQIKALAT